MARDFWTVDAETDPFHNCTDPQCLKCTNPGKESEGRIPKPFIWGAYNGTTEEYVEFADASTLADFFRSKKTIVYAHNGGRFDYHYLRDEINSDENLMIIAGRISKCRIGEAEFRDSMNIFQQTALKQFGGKVEIDYTLMEKETRDDPNVRAEISNYLRQDCVMLWENLQRYFVTYGRGLTQAGNAMKIWTRMSGVKPPSQTREQFRRYKPFYHGGRVECFRVGVKTVDFKVLDMNSAYPEAMLHKHPFSTSSTRLYGRLPSDFEIERSLIRVKCVSDGAFPYREDNGSLIFPHDDQTREYCITGWEFVSALEFNAIRHIDIIESHSFPLSIDFAEYVTRFYTQRQLAKAKQDKAEDIFCKLFMNSLYGKFGSNPGGATFGEEEDNPADGYQEYKLATIDSIDRHIVDGFKSYKPWGERSLMIRPLPEIQHRYYNVATAASITGYVRARLFRATRSCKGLIYCDTDSLSAEDVSALDTGTALGQWKLELDGRQYGVAGKKNYAFEASSTDIKEYHAYDSREAKTGHWKIASKGAKLTPKELMGVAAGETVTYRPESPTYTITRPEPRFINRKISRTSVATVAA